MTLSIAKAIYLFLAIGWYIVRIPHERRSRRTPISRSARGGKERILLCISFTGLGILPFAYVAFGFPRFATYAFQPSLAWAGAAASAAALLLFYLTHRSLGRNWSVSLDVRESHKLVTDGVYTYVRHPMYSAFWLWAIAQALLLPNWIAGPAGLVGFGTLYLFRVSEEEKLMNEAFGHEYADYIKRTGRIIPRANRPRAPR
ncbi:protein-S-isoprenylcysteine O-methyltransferase [Bosea sp. NBC_00550]|uniref:protein-S-isoprenylcysteine O-methyltransferase n=1 Tax=Bosea sp. NBC_00550 TaxID=2969621 RepID=UPI002231FAC7|nr:protein-S-isoprenylcysteine O-methyltransferase [Bosea sp. NBC_00550]UZF93582.1 protein-S-isoprenylcysteine O-methyltransferase [Bosea sp. NBC_00550]